MQSVLSGPSRVLSSTLLHEAFERLATTTAADKTAIVFEENDQIRKYTYAEINRLTDRLAAVIRHTIHKRGLPKNSDGDTIVAVSMHPSDYLVITFLAVWKSGAVVLPLDPSAPQDRFDHILAEAKPVLIIFEEDPPTENGIVKLPVGNFLNFEDVSCDELVQNDDGLAVVLYTSGSTGKMKGVRLTHMAVLNRLQWQFEAFPYGETETAGAFKTAPTFADSVPEIWGPLLSGLTLVVVSKCIAKNPEKLIGVLEKDQIQRLVLVPSLLQSLLTQLQLQETRQLKHLKTWICSGETLPVSLVHQFFRYFPTGQYRLCNFYGSTEVMGDVTFYVLASPNQMNGLDKVPIGLPIFNTKIYLLNTNGRSLRLAQAGEAAEIFVGGSNLANGYVKNRDADKFIPNPFSNDSQDSLLFRTGDFGRIADGLLMYEGRSDTQVKVRGNRVDLAEIEHALGSVEGIAKSAVLCYNPGEVGQKILAFVAFDTAEWSLERLEADLKKRLVSYMLPEVVPVDRIPLLVNGKVDRQCLLNLYKAAGNCKHQDIDYTGVKEDQLEVAYVLFDVVSSVCTKLIKPTISVNTNFYSIGGDSQNTMFTIAKLREAGYTIGVTDFMAASNLGEILNRVMPKNQPISKSNLVWQYQTEPLKDEHKQECIDMFITSFYHKSPLDYWFTNELSDPDYKEMISVNWEALLNQGLSFVVKTASGEIVAVAFNYDILDVPAANANSKLDLINEFTDWVETTVFHKLPQGKGKVYCFGWVATKITLSAKENIEVMYFIEEVIPKLAKEKGFVGIFANNIGPFTQHMATHIFEYETLLDYQINQYVHADGSKPFAMAPDSQRILIQWKSI